MTTSVSCFQIVALLLMSPSTSADDALRMCRKRSQRVVSFLVYSWPHCKTGESGGWCWEQHQDSSSNNSTDHHDFECWHTAFWHSSMLSRHDDYICYRVSKANFTDHESANWLKTVNRCTSSKTSGDATAASETVKIRIQSVTLQAITKTDGQSQLYIMSAKTKAGGGVQGSQHMSSQQQYSCLLLWLHSLLHLYSV